MAESFVGLCRVELVAVETIHDDHVRLVNTIAWTPWTPWTPCISCPYFSLQPAAILQSIDSLHRGSVGVKMVEHWSQAKFLSHFVPEVLIMLYHFIQVRMISRFKGLRLTAGRRPSNLGTMLALCWPYVGPMLAYVLNCLDTSFKPSICLPSCTASFQLACVLLQLAFVLPSSGHGTVPQGQNTTGSEGPAAGSPYCQMLLSELTTTSFKPSVQTFNCLPAASFQRAACTTCCV